MYDMEPENKVFPQQGHLAPAFSEVAKRRHSLQLEGCYLDRF